MPRASTPAPSTGCRNWTCRSPACRACCRSSSARCRRPPPSIPTCLCTWRSALEVAATLGDPVDDVGLGLARAAADFGDRVLVLQSSGNGNGGNGGDGPGGRGVSHRDWALERTSKVVVEAVAKEDVGRELT